MEPINGKTVLVTGASAGIGRATARELARHEANVAVAARSHDRLTTLVEELTSEFDTDAIAIPTDVSEHSQVEQLIDETLDAFGGLDIVVNNAAIGQPHPIDEITIEEYRTIIGVNIDGMYFVAKTTLPHLRRTNGHLIFIGSTAGQHPEPVHPLYAATKWWTRGFAQNLSGYVGEDGVAVTVINPTAVRTEFGSSFRDPNRDVYSEGSVLEPEDIAAAVAFTAAQEPPITVGELDLIRRNEFSSVDRFQ